MYHLFLKMVQWKVSLSIGSQPTLGINLGKISHSWCDCRTIFQACHLWFLDNEVCNIKMFYSKHLLFTKLFSIVSGWEMHKCFFSSFLNTEDEIYSVDIFASPNFQTICCSQIVITYLFFKTPKITQKFHKIISSIDSPIWQHCKVIDFRKKAP